MPIPLASNFKLGAALPLDSRFTKDNLSDLNAIPSGERYIGLEVYVISESKFYLWTGSTWIERDSSANITYPPQGIVVSTGTDWDTSIIPSTGYMYYTGSNWQFKNEEYALSSHTHTKAQITDFSHNHPISEITNLQSSLDAKVNTSDVVTTATANKILKLDANAKLPADITGNSATATKLETAITINGTSFDGSANITTSLWGTSRTITIGSTGKSVNGSANVSWNLAEIGAAAASHTHNLITYQDTRNNNFTPLTITGVSLHLKSNTTDGLNDGGTYHGVMHIAQWSDISGGKPHQLGLTDNNNLYIRSAVDASTWGSWEKLSKEGHTHIKSQITDFSHTHIISDVTNLQTTLDSKVNTSDVVTVATANKILKLDSNAKLPASITGNAATATKLETARTINGTSFDGSANITTSSWGTSRTITIGNTGKSVNGSANVSWSLSEIGAAATSHTHTKSQITDFNHTHPYTEVNHSITPPADGSIADSTLFNSGLSFGLVVDSNQTYPYEYGHLITFKSSDARLSQLFFPSRTYLNKNIYFRTLYNQYSEPWVKIWNELNDGSGSGLDADLLDGYHSSSFALASHTHSNYTPFASNSQTIPMNTPSGAWYRIATSVSGVGRNDGIFELEFAGSGHHQRVSFRASSLYNSDNSIQIVKMGGSKYINDSTYYIQNVRVVYYPNTYSSQYAYVEVFVTNPNTTTNAALYVRMVDAIGWSLTTGAGSIPTNYAAKELSVKNYNPIYNTNDKRGVVTPPSGILNIDLRLANKETVACNITQNTTINISGLYDGAAGTILLYLNGTYTITLGTMTNDVGNSVTKHTSGTFLSLAAGYYIIAYRVLPDASGIWRVFFNISSEYN